MKNKKIAITLADFFTIVIFILTPILLSLAGATLIVKSTSDKSQERMTDYVNTQIKTLERKFDRLDDNYEDLLADYEMLTFEFENLKSKYDILVAEIDGDQEEEDELIVEDIVNVNVSNKWNVGDSVPLPSIATDMYLCTDYRHYNLPNTPHYRMQKAAWTDDIGCRRFNNDYIVGLGSGYTVNIGDRFGIELENGHCFTVIMGDGKADCDTDAATHRYTPCKNYKGQECANVLEFIIDDQKMDKKAYGYGSISYYADFNSNIKKMIYLGRDNNGDWSSY